MDPNRDPWAARPQGAKAATTPVPAVWETRDRPSRAPPREGHDGPRFGTVDVVLLGFLGLGLFLCWLAFDALTGALDLVTAGIGSADVADVGPQIEAAFTRMTILFAAGGGLALLAFTLLRWRWEQPAGRVRHALLV